MKVGRGDHGMAKSRHEYSRLADSKEALAPAFTSAPVDGALAGGGLGQLQDGGSTAAADGDDSSGALGASDEPLMLNGGGLLKRELGFLDLTLIGIGASVGSGIFVLTGVAAQSVGPGVVFSFGIAAAISALNGLCFAELAGRYPYSGGAYLFTKRTFGARASLVVGVNLLCDYHVGAAAIARSFAGYLYDLVIAIAGGTDDDDKAHAGETEWFWEVMRYAHERTSARARAYLGACVRNLTLWGGLLVSDSPVLSPLCHLFIYRYELDRRYPSVSVELQRGRPAAPRSAYRGAGAGSEGRKSHLKPSV